MEQQLVPKEHCIVMVYGRDDVNVRCAGNDAERFHCCMGPYCVNIVDDDECPGAF